MGQYLTYIGGTLPDVASGGIINGSAINALIDDRVTIPRPTDADSDLYEAHLM